MSSSTRRSSLVLFFIVVLLLRGLVLGPPLFSLLSIGQTSLVVSLSVVSNAGVPPEGVDSHRVKHYKAVVGLMVVADPCSNESPELFPSWVGANSCDFLRSSSYKKVRLMLQLTHNWSVPQVSGGKSGSMRRIAFFDGVGNKMNHLNIYYKI